MNTQTVETTQVNQTNEQNLTPQDNDSAKRFAAIAAAEKRNRESFSKREQELSAKEASLKEMEEMIKYGRAVKEKKWDDISSVLDFDDLAKYKMTPDTEKALKTELETKLESKISALEKKLEEKELAQKKNYEEMVTREERNYINQQLTKAAAEGKHSILAKIASDSPEVIEEIYNMWKTEDDESRKTTGHPKQFDFDRYASLAMDYQNEQIKKYYSWEDMMKLYGKDVQEQKVDIKAPISKTNTLTNTQTATQQTQKISGDRYLQKSKEDAAKLIKFI